MTPDARMKSNREFANLSQLDPEGAAGAGVPDEPRRAKANTAASTVTELCL